MARRRDVALASFIVLAGLIVGAGAGLFALTQSDGGREWIRRQAQRGLGAVIRGQVHVGRLGGSFLTDLTLDSLEIRDPDDSLFVALGPTRVAYDPRDLADGRIVLRALDVQRPRVELRQDSTRTWNFRKVFPPGPPGTARARRAFGSLVHLYNVRLREARVAVSQPWAPSDSLRGARRDSTFRAEAALPGHEIRRSGSGFLRTWRWDVATLVLASARLTDPDSAGRHLDVARLDATGTFPPMTMRNVRGHVEVLGDTVTLALPHFELPGTVGSAAGRVWWGSGLPTRYDVKLVGDTVSLADVVWVYETLPTTGGGRMRLHIRNARDDLRVIEYALSDLDVRTTGSRLRGAMTFGVGDTVLRLTEVALEAAPVTFDLITRFNGEPLPYPWRGAITGTVRARGGRVNRWQLDDARFRFVDWNVPGAETRGRARGGLDILQPAFTVFRGLTVELDAMDLRTMQALNDSFPRLNGIMAGRAVLDSSWLDVRFREGDFTHRDGDSPVSRFRGNGRVTIGERDLTYDLSLAALPLSFSALARSYPDVPVRGEFSGPLRVQGTIEDLTLTADLAGDAGRLQTDGRFDLYAPRFAATARYEVDRLDLRRLLGDSTLPSTSLTGRGESEVTGDSLADLQGPVRFRLDRSTVGASRLYAGNVVARFLRGAVALDTLRLESSLGTLSGAGGVGLASGRSDTLRLLAVVDSLGGLRPWISSPASEAVRDSLAGAVTARATVTGSIRDLAVEGRLEGAGLVYATSTARAVRLDAGLRGWPDSLRGRVALRIDTARVGTWEMTEARATADLDGPRAFRLSTSVEGGNGAVIAAQGRATVGDTTRAVVDSLRLTTSGNEYRLAAPARIVVTADRTMLDTLALVGRAGGAMGIGGVIPRDAGLAVRAWARALPMTDLGEIAQSPTPLSGQLSTEVTLTGSRRDPVIGAEARLRDAGAGALLRVADLSVQADYAARRLRTRFVAARDGRTALTADGVVPMDLALEPRERRLLDEPISGRVRSDSVGLELLEAVSPQFQGARGRFAMDLALSGTSERPRVTGSLTVADGALPVRALGGVTWRDLQADIRFLGDSIAIRQLQARSGAQRDPRLSLDGWVSLRDLEDPRFDLRLDTKDFTLVSLPRVATLDVSGGLRLRGAWTGATLTGGLTVERGVIRLPELYQKNVISVDDPEYYRIVDTTALLDHRLLPAAPSAFVRNLTVQDVPIRLGNDVWLRSAEANVNLGGEVTVTRGRVTSGRNVGQVQLALEGPLRVNRGTYRLNLGPVSRTFTVEAGEVRFFGDPELNPSLNITALHTVRQAGQQGLRPDIRVRVTIGGTLLSPTAAFSTPDSLRVAQSDLLAYLVTGSPGNEVGGGASAGATATNLLLSSVAGAIGSAATGGLCDDASVSTAGLIGYGGRLQEVGGSILSGTRFNCAKQLSERLFVRLDAGLCQVGQLVGSGGGGTDPLAFADAIGVKLDYRLRDALTASAGVEPPTSATYCSSSLSARGFAPTPRQVSVDLFKTWTF